MTSRCLQDSAIASGSRQDASRWRQQGIRMTSGWRLDGVREASEVFEDSPVSVRSASGCAKLRQEGVRVAS